MVIAIDGPAGSGKSTTAKLLAEKLSFIYLDTGAMYRAVTLYFLDNSINIRNSSIVSKTLENIDLSIKFSNKFEVYINGKNVTNKIRGRKINALVSRISKIHDVRKKMVIIQRSFSKEKDIVIEGRDIGSYVFPNAEFKFFLVANILERAKRRLKEIKSKRSIDLSELISNLEERDKIDSTRKISPLLKSDDAIEINTTSLTIKEQVDKIYNIINN